MKCAFQTNRIEKSVRQKVKWRKRETKSEMEKAGDKSEMEKAGDKSEMEGPEQGRGRGQGWSGSIWSGPSRGLRGTRQTGWRGYQGYGQQEDGSISLSNENSLSLQNTRLTLEANVEFAMGKHQQRKDIMQLCLILLALHATFTQSLKTPSGQFALVHLTFCSSDFS